jgi:hypothetical protein
VAQHAIDTMWGKTAETSADGADVILLKDGGTTEKTLTLTLLATYIRSAIEATILDISDLADGSGTLATTDFMLVTQGTTARQVTLQDVNDAIYTGLAAHVAAATASPAEAGTDVFYYVKAGVPYKVTLDEIATYVNSTATLSGSGTASQLAEWSGANSLIAGPAVTDSGSGFAAGADTAVPTTAAVRGELDQLIFDSTDIGAALADADTILVDDGGVGTTQRKSTLTRLWTWALAKIVAITDVSTHGYVLDEDTMVSDDATKVPTQQSVKAYVDTQVAGVAGWDGDITDADIAGGTDIGADLADADLLIVDDGATGTIRKTALSRIRTYIEQNVKLDDLQAPDDNTDLNASAAAHGLLPKLENTGTKVLYDNGTWAVPPGAAGGEANTASGTAGGTGVEIFKTKTAVDLEFYDVKAGASGGINVALSGDDILFDLDIDGATDIGGALAGTDLLIVDDGAGGTNRKCDVSRIKTYVETAGTYKTLWVGAGAMTPTSTAGAEAVSNEWATNDINMDVLAFDGLTQDEFADFTLVMPEAWDRSTIKYKVFWTNGDAAANPTEYVQFYLSAGSLADDDGIDAALGTAVDVEDQLITDDDLHVTAASAALTVGGSPGLGDLIHFKLGRDYDHAGAGAAMDVDAYVIGVLIQYRETQTVAAW